MTSNAPADLDALAPDDEIVVPRRGQRFSAGWGLVGGAGLLALVVLSIGLSFKLHLTGGVYATSLSWVVVGIATARLAYLCATGTPALLEISFWTYVLAFEGFAAVAQLHEGSFPLRQVARYTSGEVADAQTRVIIGCIAFMFGRRFLARRSPRPLRWQLSAVRARWLAYFGLFAVAMGVATKGLKAYFTSRQEATFAAFNVSEQFARVEQLNDKAGGLLFTAATQVPIWIAALVLYRKGARNRSWLLLGAVAVGCVIADNPISNTRAWSGTVVIGFIATRVRFDRRWLAVFFTIGTLTITLFAYSYLDYFRVAGGNVEQGSPAEILRTSWDFGNFQQGINASQYVEDEGYQRGKQLLGSALILVPRKLWPDKPGATGNLVARLESNVSASLFSEMHVDFGIIGVVVGLALFGALVGTIDWRFIDHGDEILLAFLPPLAAFEVFLVRGALQPAFGALLPILACIFFVCVRKPAGEALDA